MRLVRHMSAYVRGASVPPLTKLTIPQAFRKTAEKFPDKEAVVFVHQNIRKTFQEFENDTNQLAAGMLGSGLCRGDRVAIWSHNHYEWIVTQFAAAKAGLILVNINPSYRPTELAYALGKCQVRGLISDVEWGKQDYLSVFDAALQSSSLPDLDFVAFRETGVSIDPFKRQNGESLKTITYGELANAGGKDEISSVETIIRTAQASELVNIQFTSGTTGLPKGATLTHSNVLNNAVVTGDRGYYTENDRLLVNVPLYHCFGCVGGSLTMAMHGSSLFFPHPSFSAVHSLQTAKKEKTTVWLGTPTMYVDMLSSPERQGLPVVDNGRAVMGGALVSPDLSKKCSDEFGLTAITAYGCTENSPCTFFTSPNDTFEQRTTTCGATLAHTEAKVVAKDGTTVNRGEIGEILIRGYCVFPGYWDDQEKTAEVVDKNGWYSTGDLGTLDEDGYLRIAGRSKDMIIRGGENIYPAEVEDAFNEHPDVIEAAVVGLSDERMGEEVVAFIRVKENASKDIEPIRKFLKDRLTYFKVPKYITVVDDYPMTVTGKVQKFELRKQAEKMFK